MLARIFVQIAQWVQIVQLVKYKTKNENLEDLCLALR